MDKDLLKDFIWHRAKAVEGCDPDKRRKDMAGAWIEWDQYETEREYGWGLYPLFHLVKVAPWIGWLSFRSIGRMPDLVVRTSPFIPQPFHPTAQQTHLLKSIGITLENYSNDKSNNYRL